MWRLSYSYWETEHGNGKRIAGKRLYDCKGCKGGVKIFHTGGHMPPFFMTGYKHMSVCSCVYMWL